MEEFLTNSTSPPKFPHFSNFSLSDSDTNNPSKRHVRHHSNSYSNSGGSMSYDRASRRPGQTVESSDHLRERVRAYDKGLGKIYQVYKTP